MNTAHQARNLVTHFHTAEELEQAARQALGENWGISTHGAVVLSPSEQMGMRKVTVFLSGRCQISVDIWAEQAIEGGVNDLVARFNRNARYFYITI